MPGKKVSVLFVSVLLISALSGKAQKMEIGLLAGGSGYMGDLNTDQYQRYTNLALGGLFRWNINPRNTVKLSFLHGTIQANDAKSTSSDHINRNLHFKSPLNEFSMQF